MKKIALFLALILVGSAAMAAAPAKPAAQASPKMYVGVMNKTITGLGIPVNVPFVGFVLSPGLTLDVGLTLASCSAPNQTLMGIFGRINGAMAEISKVKVGWSGALYFGSDSATSSTAFALNGGLFAEYNITDSLSVFGDATILQFCSSTSGGSSVTNMGILTADPNCFTGFRVYL